MLQSYQTKHIQVKQEYMDTSCPMTRNQAKESWIYINTREHIPSGSSLLIPLLPETVIWLALGTHDRALQGTTGLIKSSTFNLKERKLQQCYRQAEYQFRERNLS